MNNAISNNPNYDMPDDSFFNFYFLIHKNRIFTTKIALKVGEITTALLNMKAEDMKKIYDLTVSFAGFADNNMAMKNEQTMTEFVDRIIEIEQIAVTLPPYCYVNIDLKKEKQRAEIMKSKAFYGRLYDMTSEEFAEYERYKKLFSGYGIGLYIIACCIAEMSDEYFTRLKKRDESNTSELIEIVSQILKISADKSEELLILSTKEKTSIDEYQSMLESGEGMQDDKLEDKLRSDCLNPEDLMLEQENQAFAMLLADSLDDILSHRQAEYIRMYFGIGCAPQTFEQIGEEFCVNAGTVEKGVKSALKKLKEYID